MKNYAIQLAQAGWPILPCKPDKSTHIRGGFKSATTNPEKIGNWWDLHPSDLIGIATPPHMFIIDIDTPKNSTPEEKATALADAENWLKETCGGTIPPTLTVRTGGGGKHYYFTANPDTLKNYTNSTKKLHPHIDLRLGGKGYTIAPPSQTKYGKYEWLHGNPLQGVNAVAPAPHGLLQALADAYTPQATPAKIAQLPPPQQNLNRLINTTTAANRSEAYGTRALESAYNIISTATQGTRNDTLNREALGIWQLVHEGLISEHTAISTLHEAATRAGLPDNEIRTTLASAREGAKRKPRQTLPDFTETQQRSQTATATPHTPAQTIREQFPLFNWRTEWDRAGEEIEWLVKPIIPSGALVDIYSPPKTGKSLFALDMASSLATGTQFLGYATQKTKVLYIDYENDPYRDTIARLKTMGHTPDQLDGLEYLHMPVIHPLDTPTGAAQLLGIINTYQPKLVIFDTLSRILEGDENDAGTFRRLYSHTLQHLKRQGIATIRLDHVGKDTTKGARGSSAKSADVDLTWKLTADAEKKDQLTLTCMASRAYIERRKIKIERDTTTLHHLPYIPNDALIIKELEANRAWDEAGHGSYISQREARATLQKAGIQARDATMREWLKDREKRGEE